MFGDHVCQTLSDIASVHKWLDIFLKFLKCLLQHTRKHTEVRDTRNFTKFGKIANNRALRKWWQLFCPLPLLVGLAVATCTCH
jgi:hypothetical protein